MTIAALLLALAAAAPATPPRSTGALERLVHALRGPAAPAAESMVESEAPNGALLAKGAGLSVEATLAVRIEAVGTPPTASAAASSTATSSSSSPPLTPTLSPAAAGEREVKGATPTATPTSTLTSTPASTSTQPPGLLSQGPAMSGDTLLRLVEPDGRLLERTVDRAGAITSERTVGHVDLLPVLALRRAPLDGHVVRLVEADGSLIEVELDPMGRFITARPASAPPAAR